MNNAVYIFSRTFHKCWWNYSSFRRVGQKWYFNTGLFSSGQLKGAGGSNTQPSVTQVSTLVSDLYWGNSKFVVWAVECEYLRAWRIPARSFPRISTVSVDLHHSIEHVSRAKFKDMSMPCDPKFQKLVEDMSSNIQRHPYTACDELVHPAVTHNPAIPHNPAILQCPYTFCVIHVNPAIPSYIMRYLHTSCDILEKSCVILTHLAISAISL